MNVAHGRQQMGSPVGVPSESRKRSSSRFDRQRSGYGSFKGVGSSKNRLPKIPVPPTFIFLSPSFSIISSPESRNCPRPNANLESDLCGHVQNPAAPPAATPSAASPHAASPSLPSASAPSSPFPPNPSDITTPDAPS